MKQVFLSIITIIAVASLATVGTYADFSDSEEEVGDTLQAGSLDMQLGDTKPWPNIPFSQPPYDGGIAYDPDEDYGADPRGDSVEYTWDYELGYPGGMVPGNVLKSRVKIRNVGSINAASMDIICVNVNTAPGSGPTDKDTKMIIEELRYYYDPPNYDDLVDWLSTELSGKSPITLDDWENTPVTGLTPPPPGAQAFLDMTIVFDPTTPFLPPPGLPGTYQGCQTMMTLIFSLHS